MQHSLYECVFGTTIQGILTILCSQFDIPDLRRQLTEMGARELGRDRFLAAVRKFMQMETLTAPLLRELIDRIKVYETEGTGRNRTKRVVIHYRFVGYIVLPDNLFTQNYRADTRQGVSVEYLRSPVTA